MSQVVQDFFINSVIRCLPSSTLRMAMNTPPFVDVFSIEDGDFPLPCWFTGVYSKKNIAPEE